MKKNIVICDIDGTITKVGDRTKYIKTDPKDWDAFYAACGEDEPNVSIVEMVQCLAEQYQIIFFTGRRESCRQQTITQLGRFFGCEKAFQIIDGIFFRNNGDFRSDVEVKPEMIERARIKKEEVSFILEDRTCMVKKWRELGYTCLQVADGDY
jgi:hypothetical protein